MTNLADGECFMSITFDNNLINNKKAKIMRRILGSRCDVMRLMQPIDQSKQR